MNKEEKEAIETLQGLCTDDCINKDVVQTVVNLIEKQQKEIEDLKNDHIDFWINTKEVEDMVRGKFISKDKIKAKIGE